MSSQTRSSQVNGAPTANQPPVSPHYSRIRVRTMSADVERARPTLRRHENSGQMSKSWHQRCPREPTGMTEVDKSKILQILRDRGLHARAEWVDRQLPERVDLEKNAGLLATLHISPSELADPQP